jgi:hypothetical protein
MKKFISIIICVFLCFSLFGCNKKEITKIEKYGIDKTNLYGFFEPLWEKKYGTDENQINGFNLDVTIDLMQAMGATSIRLLFPASIFSKFIVDYESGSTEIELKSEMKEYFHEVISKLKNSGIKLIIGESIVYPPFTSSSGKAFPNGSLTAPFYGVDDCYEIWMKAVSAAWQKLSAEFNEINVWEMGNEYNTDPYMHPSTYNISTKEGGFEINDLAAINTDYMYYSTKGIKAGNAQAVTLTPGYTSNGNMNTREIEYFLTYIYEYIASGNYPRVGEKSTKTNDFFTGLSWHPYNFGSMPEKWKEYNNDIYQIVVNNGDEGKKVYFTEIGWYDNNNDSIMTAQETFIRNLYKWCKEDLWYVESCMYFRFYNCNYDWSGGGEAGPEKTFGVFYEPTLVEGFKPKTKATVMKEIFGGKGDLNMWSDLDALNQKILNSKW